MARKRQINFYWRYQPLADSPDGIMLSYLKNFPNQSAQALILQAVRAFWLPLALAEAQDISKTKLQDIGRIAVYDLLRQIEHLCAVLELEHPAVLMSVNHVHHPRTDTEIQEPESTPQNQEQLTTALLLETTAMGDQWDTGVENI